MKRSPRLCLHPEGVGHDCMQVEAINAVIEDATQLADELTKGLSPGDRDYAWTRAFHNAMDSLTERLGIRRRVPRA